MHTSVGISWLVSNTSARLLPMAARMGCNPTAGLDTSAASYSPHPHCSHLHLSTYIHAQGARPCLRRSVGDCIWLNTCTNSDVRIFAFRVLDEAALMMLVAECLWIGERGRSVPVCTSDVSAWCRVLRVSFWCDAFVADIGVCCICLLIRNM